MTMSSYGQSHEDVLLRRVFPGDTPGFYVDVGANDPVVGSVTRHFYERGWRGINIEPIPRMFEQLCADRPRDINLNIGLSDHEGDLPFYEVPSIPGWSTFSAGLAREYRDRGLATIERVLPVMTLAQVCARHVAAPIDFLKVDVEGFEREVLNGADWGPWRPRVVLIEDAWPDRWEELILRSNYLFATCEGMNRYYVREEERHLIPALRAPIGPGDDFVLYKHVQIIRAMTDRFDECEDLGPNALKAAFWLHRLAARHPRIGAVCKRAMRLAC